MQLSGLKRKWLLRMVVMIVMVMIMLLLIPHTQSIVYIREQFKNLSTLTLNEKYIISIKYVLGLV